MPLPEPDLAAAPPYIKPFAEQLKDSGLSPFTAQAVEILQINLGRLCNLSCKHCHLEAGPNRTEIMSRKVLESCLAIAKNSAVSVIDITGGAPEMNPHLPWFVTEASKLGKRLIVRSNLVILREDPFRDYIDLYTRNKVEIVGSLPDIHGDKTDRQRGAGVFSKEISVIRELNALGYGREDSGLVLDLVHNPVGAFLPGSQKTMEFEFKRILLTEHGLLFNHLFCLTNNPSGRYLDYLVRSGNYEDYMQALIAAFNPSAAAKAMCRSTLSVGWDGQMYDCDFNQALNLPVNHGAPWHINQFDLPVLAQREIVVANHCYACTAGSGSSCQGATD
jgi:radical SAM/Cys-rich protein